MKSSKITVREMWEHIVSRRAQSEFLVYIRTDSGTRTSLTYAQMDRRVNQVANLFISLGVAKGDRVAIGLPNSLEHVECILALAKIGAIYVPLNDRYTQREASAIIESCSARILVTTRLLADAGITAGVEAAIVTDGLREGLGSSSFDSAHDFLDFNESTAIQSNELSEYRSIHDQDVVEILYTSGTCAHPKGIMLTHANLVFSGWYVNWQLAMNENDRYFTTMSVSHVNFQLSALMPVITSGSALILEERYSASRFWSRVRQSNATLVQSMAMFARTMLMQPVDPDERKHSVRFVHYFLPLSDDEKTQYEERFGIELINNYGSTESLIGNLTDFPFGPRNWPSIGQPGLGYRARIVDEDRIEVPAGTVGELQIQGEQGTTLMLGYWNDPELTARAIDQQGWYSTGDMCYQDENGWYYFVGRDVDIIKRGGENISALEIESVLRDMRGIFDVAVVGVPDPVRDESVVAFVIRDDQELTEDDVIRYAHTRLADFKVPSQIHFCSSLPRGEYEKVRKRLLTTSTVERECNGN